ncbi:MAG: hypothetical protein BWX50_01186 [Euryarchaeota archaeon ADurb.Bin009]|nr:MAG: hypothetical protein BWX50_01186 [Euryarchaeota archaeon ADurb.Bin009]
MSSAPMRIRMPARAESGISSASGPATRMTAPTRMPEMRFAARVSAPALTFKAVAESEPLEGAHWKKLASMFATPCPAKSRLTSAMVPSGSGVFSVIPMAITRPMMARASAGTRRPGARASSGRTGNGRPAGMALISPTSATSRSAARTRRVVMTIGKRRPMELRRGARRKMRARAMVRRPTANGCTWISPACSMRSRTARIWIASLGSS